MVTVKGNTQLVNAMIYFRNRLGFRGASKHLADVYCVPFIITQMTLNITALQLEAR